ncbi:MAG: alpha/beta hydrolase [Hyphomicrobiaceae bacterium TMED74]|nr:alpha/beta hydrolase [Filomicrobium sp.]RPG40333.1 MAG: alpha/beta hydrolase [Hyphomicrobiaceae bacterium TMED74]
MSNHVSQIETSRLSVEVEVSGPDTGRPVMLLHGWPDSLRCWDLVVPALHAAGIRTIVPSLRAYGATRFLNPDTPRSGQVVALARDALELADALSIDRFTVVGHDWGARAVFDMSTLAPERLTAAVAMSLGWKTPDHLLPLSPEQGRAFWYQWYFATRHGEIAFRDAPREFCRYLWDTWGPSGWYSEDQWKAASAAWTNPYWPDVVLHFYRNRWKLYQPDPAYDADEKVVRHATTISVPTRIIYGAADTCCLPEISENCDPFFPAGYSYNVLPDIGHFPQYERPDAVADLILDWHQKNTSD